MFGIVRFGKRKEIPMFMFKKFNLSMSDAETILSDVYQNEDWIDRAKRWSHYGCIWDGDAEDLYAQAYETVKDANAIKFGVCAGRHEIPVTDYIFDEICDVTDFDAMFSIAAKKIRRGPERVHLYVTGLTPATLAIVSACRRLGRELVAFHFDKESGEYIPQRVL